LLIIKFRTIKWTILIKLVKRRSDFPQTPTQTRSKDKVFLRTQMNPFIRARASATSLAISHGQGQASSRAPRVIRSRKVICSSSKIAESHQADIRIIIRTQTRLIWDWMDKPTKGRSLKASTHRRVRATSMRRSRVQTALTIH